MRIVIALVLNATKLIFSPWLLIRRRRAAPRGAWLTLSVQGSVVSIADEPRFWDRTKRPISLHEVRQVALLAREDPRVTGLLVDLKDISGGGASAMALRDAIAVWKDSGKRVIVSLTRGARTRSMLVASIADTIVAPPGTEIAPMGFAVEAPYVKDALERLGLEPEVLARGRYKTAGEFLVSRSMSDAQREQLERVLDVSWNNLIDTLSKGRRVSKKRAQQWVDEGPWISSEACEQGMIDSVSHQDELLRSLSEGGVEEAPTMPLNVYARRRKISFRPIRRQRRIAVVDVHGPIASDRTPGWAPMALETQVCDALTEAREIPWIDGVIVHIDSRGGSATASERMLHEVKRLALKKPVVACLADAAASGGYMIAVGAHRIVSQPTTLTGSIGVVSARVVAGKLAERLGVRTETIKRGSRADMLSPLRHLGAEERIAIDRLMENVYKRFLRAVAEGRGREVEEIEPLAAGRVWSGADALEHGLVDCLGGFDVALDEVRRLIGKGASATQPILWGPGKPLNIRQMLMSLSGAESLGVGRIGDLIALAEGTTDRVWLWCPWTEKEG